MKDLDRYLEKQQAGKTGLSEDDKHDIFDLLQEEV